MDVDTGVPGLGVYENAPGVVCSCIITRFFTTFIAQRHLQSILSILLQEAVGRWVKPQSADAGPEEHQQSRQQGEQHADKDEHQR